MNVIKPSAAILYPETTDDVIRMYQLIEKAGRTCYKSENNITIGSSAKFISSLIRSGHEAMIEHASMTVKFIVDRGVSHEIVRHRVASFAQESTRYCNYSKEKFGKELTFIKPFFFEEGTEEYKIWEAMVRSAEVSYIVMVDNGVTPQEARSILPNSLKTELVMTANLREWRHFFKLRAAGTTGKPHPQMAEVAIPLLKQCQEMMPEVFGDIQIEQNKKTGDTLSEYTKTCKYCKHRGFSENGKSYGFSVEFPEDSKCPCQCSDGYYSWIPDDDFYCKNWELKT